MTSPIPSELRTPQQIYHASAAAGAAIRLTAVAIASIYVLQAIAATFVSPVGAFVMSYGATSVGVIAFARVHGFRLGITLAPLPFWISATLVGMTAWYIDLTLVTWISPPGDAAHLQILLDQTSIAGAVIAIAIVPAIAEEIIFRGVLARSIARRSATAAIAVSAVVFSLYHIHPVQIVATFPLGLALAVIAVRSDSILPGMFTHFLNNALVIALSHDAFPDVTASIERHPGPALAVAVAGMAIGVILPNCKAHHKRHLN